MPIILLLARPPQKSGSLAPDLDSYSYLKRKLSYFQYAKKNNREQGPAVVGIELQKKEDFAGLIAAMEKYQINFRYLNEDSDFYTHLIGVLSEV